MFVRFRTGFMLMVSFLLVGTVMSVDARWQSGTVLESFRAWLGQPAQRTKMTVDHTSSGVVLKLTASDTATVNRLQAALPEQNRSLQGSNELPSMDNQKSPAGDASETEDDRYEDEDCTEDDEDHGSD